MADVLTGTEAALWLANWLLLSEETREDLARRSKGRDSAARANLFGLLHDLPPESTWDPRQKVPRGRLAPRHDNRFNPARTGSDPYGDSEAAIWDLHRVYAPADDTNDTAELLDAFVPSQTPCRGTFSDLVHVALPWAIHIERTKTAEGIGRTGRPSPIHRRGVLRAIVEATRRTRCFNAGKDSCKRWLNEPRSDCECGARGAYKAVALIFWTCLFAVPTWWANDGIGSDHVNWLRHSGIEIEVSRRFPGGRIELSNASVEKLAKYIGNEVRKREGEYQEYAKYKRGGG